MSYNVNTEAHYKVSVFPCVASNDRLRPNQSNISETTEGSDNIYLTTCMYFRSGLFYRQLFKFNINSIYF